MKTKFESQPIVPSLNTLSFWPIVDGKLFVNHGLPEDQMMKYKLMEPFHVLDDGFEIFVMTSKLTNVDQFESWFYKQASKRKYKTVHIGEAQADFLISTPDIEKQLKILNNMMDNLETDRLIIHAHHFQEGRNNIKQLFNNYLPNKIILIENNGFDNYWGHSIDGLKSIFEDCPDYQLCLDINHLKDFDDYSLKDFINEQALVSRIAQIHYAYSPHLSGRDPYEDKGFNGYKPYHALWSIVGFPPSEETKNFITQYPVVCEGVVPREDKKMEFLRKEIAWLQ